MVPIEVVDYNGICCTVVYQLLWQGSVLKFDKVRLKLHVKYWIEINQN